jgi:chromate transporter
MTSPPSLWQLFQVFFVMGATSIGGGVVGYLRSALVVRQRWVDDATFVELLAISQTLPGLNATNMSILVGDRLRGTPGAVLAALGMCLPGAALMTAAAFAYGIGGDDPISKAFLHAIAAGAVGLIVVVMVQLGAKVLSGLADYIFDRGPRRRLPGPGPSRDDRHGRHRDLVASAAQGAALAMKQLLDIGGVFAYLSLLTVGGGVAAFPELKELTVNSYHWLTFPELLHYYSIGQLAPGPNMMMVASVGAHVAGLTGAAVALVAFILPTGVFTLVIGRLWNRLANWPWRPAIQRGLGSVAVGLVLSGAIVMARGAFTNPYYLALGAAVFILLMLMKINPALPIVASGILGVAAYLL